MCRSCSCVGDPELQQSRRDAVQAVPVVRGQVYEDGVGNTVVVTQLVTREGVEYAYCDSPCGEMSIPVQSAKPPVYRLVTVA